MRAFFSKLPLRLSAPVVLSLPVLAAVAVLSLIAFWQARSAANKLAGDQLVEIHGRINQRLSDLLKMPARINRINAEMIEEGRLDLADLRSWRGFLYEEAMAFDMLSGILWGSAEGEVVWMFRYPGKEGYEFGIRDDATGEEVLEFRMDAKDQMSAGAGRPLRLRSTRSVPGIRDAVAPARPPGPNMPGSTRMARK